MHMHISLKITLILFIISLIFVQISTGDERTSQRVADPVDVKIAGQWFLAYLNGQVNGTRINQFTVNRGYITFNTRFNSSLSGRITPDVSVDQEGDGAGDLELRLKYAYLKWDLPDMSVLVKPSVEFGLARRPWLNFEESINNYRVQGTMYLARNGVINSADFGLMFMALLGGEMDDHYKQNVNGQYPGRYGSIAFGLYNGGGYHALEQNANKSIEGRLSLRPFPESLPGFQASYHGVYGKGNIKEKPDWFVNMGYLSWQQERFSVSATYHIGVGNFKGTAVDSMGKSLDQSGYSLFGEYDIPLLPLSLMARYDCFAQDIDEKDNTDRRYILGLAYHIYNNNRLLIDFDRNEGNSLYGENTSRLGITVEVKF